MLFRDGGLAPSGYGGGVRARASTPYHSLTIRSRPARSLPYPNNPLLDL